MQGIKTKVDVSSKASKEITAKTQQDVFMELSHNLRLHAPFRKNLVHLLRSTSDKKHDRIIF
jgi:hypothetical protein